MSLRSRPVLGAAGNPHGPPSAGRPRGARRLRAAPQADPDRVAAKRTERSAMATRTDAAT